MKIGKKGNRSWRLPLCGGPWTMAHLTLLHPPHTQLMVLHNKETENYFWSHICDSCITSGSVSRSCIRKARQLQRTLPCSSFQRPSWLVHQMLHTGPHTVDSCRRFRSSLCWCLVAQSSYGLVCQAPPSMAFPWQEYWGGLPFPFSRGSSQPRSTPMFPALASGFYHLPPGKPFWRVAIQQNWRIY